MTFLKCNPAADKTCSICLEDFVTDQPNTGVYHGEAGGIQHPFHPACIDSWINGSHIAGKAHCPACNYEVTHLSSGDAPTPKNNQLENDQANFNPLVNIQMLDPATILMHFPEATFSTNQNGEIEFVIPMSSSDFTGDIDAFINGY